MSRFRKILNLFFAAVLILMVIAAIAINENSTYRRKDFNVDLSDGWTAVEPDGSQSEVVFPYPFQNGSHHIQITRTLPQVSDYVVLLVKCNYKSLTAYVDGEEIYHSLPSTFGMATTDLGHYVSLIPLSSEYSGKEILLSIEERDSGYNSDIKHILLTIPAQYGFQQLEQKSLSVIISLIMMFCAAISLIAWFIFCEWNGIIPEERYHPLLWNSLFAASVGLWFFSEPHIWGIATGSFATSGVFNYLAFSLMPLSLLGILKSICSEPLPSLRYIVYSAKIILIIEWLLFLTGIIDLSDILPFLQACCVLAMGIFVFYMVWKRDLYTLGPTIRYGMWGVMGMLVFAVIAYICDNDWTPWALGTVVVLLVSVLISTLFNINQAIKDISQTKQYKENALTDIMTGLKSRYAFTIFEAQQKVGIPSSDLHLIYMDIDRLKMTNDTLGHVAGDEMIIATSKCIREAFGDLADCFRMGGDEFLIAMNAKSGIVQKRIALFNRKISHWKGRYIDSLTVSYGIAVASDHPDMDFEELLRTADNIMYANKKKRYAHK